MVKKVAYLSLAIAVAALMAFFLATIMHDTLEVSRALVRSGALAFAALLVATLMSTG
jgi:hypothetical protein